MLRLNKDSRFDIFYNGTEYMDHKNLTVEEVNGFLGDCERMFGRKWVPIYLPTSHARINKIHFYHIVHTLSLHGYIVCYPNEITRHPFHKTLDGESSLLKEVEESNYFEKQERKRKRCQK